MVYTLPMHVEIHVHHFIQPSYDNWTCDNALVIMHGMQPGSESMIRISEVIGVGKVCFAFFSITGQCKRFERIQMRFRPIAVRCATIHFPKFAYINALMPYPHTCTVFQVKIVFRYDSELFHILQGYAASYFAEARHF